MPDASPIIVVGAGHVGGEAAQAAYFRREPVIK
jgi:tRNA U34 5-carboxymethylaminomethyl modifying enzyme MnmG/GidA